MAIASLRAGVPISKMLAQDAMKRYRRERPEADDGPDSQNRRMHLQAHCDELKSKIIHGPSGTSPVAMYLCKRLTKHSYPEIGREFGGSITRPNAQLKKDPRAW